MRARVSPPPQIRCDILDAITEKLRDGLVVPAMDELFLWLRLERSFQSKEDWSRCVAACREHLVSKLVHADPFTWRAYAKPRGYAGDAVMMDYIYSAQHAHFTPEFTSAQGENIFHFTTEAAASRAVRARREKIAALIDAIATRVASPRILSLACGHLREAELSTALQQGRITTWMALDQDAESLALVQRDYGHQAVEARQMAITALLKQPKTLGAFDVVYASGLYDYLPQRLARRLTRTMFDLLRPGGTALVTNFVPDIADLGYMECFMDWHMMYRNHRDMLDLASSIPADQIEQVRFSTDSDRNLWFMEVEKKGLV